MGERVGKPIQSASNRGKEIAEFVVTGGELIVGESWPVGIGQQGAEDFGVPGILTAVLTLGEVGGVVGERDNLKGE